jgi:hypothetical protein
LCISGIGRVLFLEKNFYRLPFTPPLSGFLIDASTVKLAPRRLTSLDETILVRIFAFDVEDYKLVHLWAMTLLLNCCLVNF